MKRMISQCQMLSESILFPRCFSCDCYCRGDDTLSNLQKSHQLSLNAFGRVLPVVDGHRGLLTRDNAPIKWLASNFAFLVAKVL